ncbi:CcdC protein domain-containing protein [Alicyclobacillus dauci]|uniref:Cytochrome c biogenesis protein CcdC n=1 Tax=Alicyclobacillus dauci TaxID=1475485 RepID=A0ABY6Z0Y3_9BACL|nr:CcdC protein domain-containing protein [Alicyclobacillus dauci]WAH36537.1 cytochrome c biogenesis protein CcdC [Alicyclobacillus dauci]
MYIVPILVLVALIVWRRLSATRKPVKGNGLRMILPLLFLLFGFASFLNPGVQLSALEIIIPLMVGIVFSIPLIITTNYEIREDGLIYARKSMAFVVCLLVILALRIALRELLHGYNSSTMTMMYFLVAFGYLVPWRIASFMKFRKVLNGRGADDEPAAAI